MRKRAGWINRLGYQMLGIKKSAAFLIGLTPSAHCKAAKSQYSILAACNYFTSAGNKNNMKHVQLDSIATYVACMSPSHLNATGPSHWLA